MLKYSHVSKIFDEQAAVDDVTFEVEDGEFVLITGPSGSGKTTLLRLLIKEYIPTQGDITFNGHYLADIKGGKVALHRREVGVVFQDYKLLNEFNIWENIALPLNIAQQKEDEIERRVTDLLKLIGLTDKAFMFPKQLSGGEAQRISIARALATGPKLIFADEPTGNLDPDTSLAIVKLLKRIHQLGTTVMLASHDRVVLDDLIESRHIILNKGCLIKDTAVKPAATKKKLDLDEAEPADRDKPASAPRPADQDELDLDKPDQDKTASQEHQVSPNKPATGQKTRIQLGLDKIGSWFKKKPASAHKQAAPAQHQPAPLAKPEVIKEQSL